MKMYSNNPRQNNSTGNMKKEDTLLFKMIYTAKKSLPRSTIFTIFIILLKIIGLLIFAHIYKRGGQDTLMVSSLLRKICFFKDLNNLSGLFLIDYNLLCLFIFLVVIAPFLIFLVIYIIQVNKRRRKFAEDSVGSESYFSTSDSCTFQGSAYLKTATKVAGWIFMINFILFQHYIEILYFIFLHAYVTDTTSEATPQALGNDFTHFNSQILINKYIFCLCNTITIIIANISTYFFLKISNEPFFLSNSAFKMCDSKFNLILLQIIFNFQGFHYFIFAFKGDGQMNLSAVMVGVAMACSLAVAVNLTFVFHFRVMLTLFLQFFCLESFLSGAVDIVIYNINSDKLTNSQAVITLSVKIIIVVVFMRVIRNFKENWDFKKIEENIFLKHKKDKREVAFIMLQLMDECMKDCKKFIGLFNVIYRHQLKCTKTEMKGVIGGFSLESESPPDRHERHTGTQSAGPHACSCENFKAKKYHKLLLDGYKIDGLIDSERRKKYMKLYEDFLILVQNEISNIIHQLHKNEEVSMEYSLLILYFDFIFYFRRNLNFSNFLIEQYYSALKNIPFFFKFYFYSYKRGLIKHCKEEVKQENQKSLNNFYNFLNYLKHIEKLKFLVFNTSNDFSSLIQIQNEIFKYKRNVISTVNMGNNTTSTEGQFITNFNSIYSTSRNLNRNYASLLQVLNDYFSSASVKNPEICYILTEFFHFLYDEIPFEISSKFQEISSYEEVQSFPSAYLEAKMQNPMIVSLQKMDLFSIKYISQKLCDMLHYRKEEVLNEDFNIFLPESFIPEHRILLQRTVFMQNRNYFSRTTFMLTKENYYFPIKMTSIFVPSMTDKMLLVIDIKPRELESILGVENSGINKMIEYHFILDFETNFISLSPNFEKNFGLTKEILSKTNMNFSSFFSIDTNKFSEKIRKALTSIVSIDMDNLEGMVKVFKQVNLDKALQIYKSLKTLDRMHDFEDIENGRIFQFTKRKEKILPSLAKIKKVIEESELDQNWIKRVGELEKQIYKHVSMNKLSDSKGFKHYVAGNNRRDKSSRSNSGGMYNIKLAICKIGNLPYFYATVYEQEERRELQKLAAYSNSLWGLSQATTPQIYKSAANYREMDQTPGFSSPPVDFKKTAIISHPEDFNLLNNMEKCRKKRDSPGEGSPLEITHSHVNFHTNASDYLNHTQQTSGYVNTGINDTLSNFLNGSQKGKSLFNKEGKKAKFSSIPIVEESLQNSKIKKFNQPSPKSLKPNKQNIVRNLLNDTKKRNQIQKILYSIMVLFLLVLIAVSLVNFASKSGKFEIAKNLYKINFYTLTTKAYVYFASSVPLIGCNKLDGIEPPESDNLGLNYKDLSHTAKDYSSKLLYYFNKLNTEIHLNEDATTEIIQMINEKNVFSLLYSDWSSFNRTDSSISDEIKFFNFYISKLQEEEMFNKCRIKEHFIYGREKNILDVKSLSDSLTSEDLDQLKSNYLEYVLFYVISNTMKIFTPKLEKISFAAGSLMNSYFNDNKLYATVINMVILFFAFSLIFTFSLIFRNYKNKIKNMILSFYLTDTHNQLFRKKIENLKEILYSFNTADCEMYEDKKEEIQRSRDLLLEQINSSSENVSEINNVNQNNLILEGLNFNSSMNQSVSFNNLHNLNNTSNKLKRAGPASQLTAEMISEDMLIFTEEDFKLEMPITKIFYYFFAFSFMAYLSIIITHSIKNINSIDNSILSNQMAANFIERITKLSALGLYYKISVLKNDHKFLSSPFENYSKEEFANYFNIKEDFSLDSIYDLLGDSEFSQFYYQLSIKKKNIDTFMSNTHFEEILPNTRAYESSLQADHTSDFCYNLATGSLNWIKNETSTYLEGFTKINQIASQCKKIGDQLRSNKLNNLLNIQISNLKNLYSDFVLDKKETQETQQEIEARIIKHLSQKEFIQTHNNIQILFEKLLKNYISHLLEDLNHLFDEIISTEVMYSIILLIINFIFISITMFTFVLKYESYYHELHHSMKKYTMANKI